MKNLKTKVIETERLILRKFEITDAKGMYENWASDEKTCERLSWSAHKDIEETRNLLNTWISNYEKPFYFNWVVEIKETHEVIGNICVLYSSIYDETCSLGNCYGSKYWGKGYATEAGRAVIEFLLNEVGYRLIEATNYSTNPSQGRLLFKWGMKFDGFLRQRKVDRILNEVCDVGYYSITKEDLKEQIKTELAQKVKYKKIGKYNVSNEIFLDLVFNEKCNLRCPFCIANTKSFAKEDFEKWKINLKRTFKIFKDIKSIIILGGESTIDPLFFDKLNEIEKVIKGSNVTNVILTTNGIMLKHEKFLDKLLKSCVTSINISIMNHNQKKNDNIMNGKTLTKEELEKIYLKLRENNKTMRINVNVFKGNLDSIQELLNYVNNFNGLTDIIKFTPLMKTDMFNTKEEVLDYTHNKCMDKKEIKKLFDEFAATNEIICENDSIFGLISYKQIKVNGQEVILKYEQVEDMYDLDTVIPTLKLYPNGNLANEWNYEKNILDDF